MQEESSVGQTWLCWRDLFPSYDNPGEIDTKLVTLVRLCGEIGLPFPAEPKRPYSMWWHSLHEIGHWAVKPPWYIAYTMWMRDDIAVSTGRLYIPADTIPGEGPVGIEDFSTYVAGNDLIPDIALLRDPTPGEDETRVWSLLVIQRYGWPHPFDENKVDGHAEATSGDTAFHKAASARVWSKQLVHDPEIARSMLHWGIDPLSGFFRAQDDGFRVPHLVPQSLNNLVDNMDAIYSRYGASKRPWGREERQAWINDYLEPRYGKYFDQ